MAARRFPRSTRRTTARKGGGVSVSLTRGDCLAQLKKLPDASVDLVLTDLPYGTTGCKWDTVIDLAAMWRELYRVGTHECVFVFTAQSPFTFVLAQSNPYGLKHLRQTLVWEKSNGTNPFLASHGPLKAHEDILVFCRKRARYNPQMVEGKPYVERGGTYTGGDAGGIKGKRKSGKNNGTRHPRSVQFFAWERGWHPTQKPVALMEWLIKSYSNPGHTVLDLTMGSGTTGVAAARTGRHFIGFELSAQYMAIARRRILCAQNGEPEPQPTKAYQVARPRLETLKGGRLLVSKAKAPVTARRRGGGTSARSKVGRVCLRKAEVRHVA
ncbi:cytosine methyltransferase [Pseudoxanthomonas kaohsiungensis]|nr:cytosine methyltransferase [Pseudoxanthomonas kaohsiungensis]